MISAQSIANVFWCCQVYSWIKPCFALNKFNSLNIFWIKHCKINIVGIFAKSYQLMCLCQGGRDQIEDIFGDLLSFERDKRNINCLPKRTKKLIFINDSFVGNKLKQRLADFLCFFLVRSKIFGVEFKGLTQGGLNKLF